MVPSAIHSFPIREVGSSEAESCEGDWWEWAELLQARRDETCSGAVRKEHQVWGIPGGCARLGNIEGAPDGAGSHID